MAVVSSDTHLSDQSTEWFGSLGIHRQSIYSPFSLSHRPRPRSGSRSQCIAARPKAHSPNLVAADVRRLHWNLRLGSSLDLGAWDLDLSPTVHGNLQLYGVRGQSAAATPLLLPSVRGRVYQTLPTIRIGRRCSHSPRERAGVRGKVPSASPSFTKPRSPRFIEKRPSIHTN